MTQIHMQTMGEYEIWKKQRECNIPNIFLKKIFTLHTRKQPTSVWNKKGANH